MTAIFLASFLFIFKFFVDIASRKTIFINSRDVLQKQRKGIHYLAGKGALDVLFQVFCQCLNVFAY